MHRILLADALDQEAEQQLEAAGQVVRPPVADETTLCELVANCDALIARTYTPVTRAVLSAGRRLRVVGVAGVGVDRVDLEAAAELGIPVVNTPAAATDAVADLTLALMLNLLRPVSRLVNGYRDGRFKQVRSAPHGVELCECAVGIVGMGRIGTQVGRRCAAFGARVLFNDIVPVGPFDFDAVSEDKATIWEQADIVTLHVPLTDETRGLVDAEVLARVKPGALLINTARGAVVETDALTAALSAGRLAGAALDVTDPEPLPIDHPLLSSDRCIVTPHIAARTHGGMRRMCTVVDEVLAILATSREE
jgi:phosphoglycerate dehydrogenase-like enzyme